MAPRTRTVLVGFILLFGFFARAATYKAPLLDHHAWRQADTASIARNFLNERFNILYPQVDQRGSQANGYVETGLEVFAFVVAAISRVAGFHTEAGRLLAALCFLWSCALVTTFVRRRDGPEAAVAAAFLYAFGFPLLLFIERAFMNEALLIALSFTALVATARYLERRNPLDYAALLLVTTLIGAIKLPYLIVWAPVAGLFVERDGWRAAGRWELWLMAAVTLAAAVAWYSHAHALANTTGLSFGLTDKLFDPHTVFTTAFPAVILSRLIRDILGPVGVLAVAAGGVLAWRQRRWCEVFGIAGGVIYLAVVGTGNFVHDYYQLALIPVAAILAGPGLVSTATAVGGRLRGGEGQRALAVLAGIAALATFVRLVSAHGWFEYEPREVVLCETLRRMTPGDGRIVFLGDNNPRFLFCAERKGWAFTTAESDAAHLETAKREGARIAVLYRSAARPDVREALTAHGEPLFGDAAVEVFRLN